MSVALCISGLAHGYRDAFPFLLKNLIEPLRPDIFIHTWDVAGERTMDTVAAQDLGADTCREIVQLFQPKQIVFEPFFVFDGAPYKDRAAGNIANAMSMFYKIRKCNDLKSSWEKTQGFIYEAVIRCRFDMRLQTPLAEKAFKGIDEWLYIPEGGDWGGLNDHFAFSCSQNMDAYASVFDSIDEYWNRGCRFHPESLLQYHVEERFLVYRRIRLIYRLAGSPRPMIRDMQISKTNTYRPEKAWLISPGKIRARRINEHTLLLLYAILMALSVRTRAGSTEHFIFLLPPPASSEHNTAMANRLAGFWRLSGLSVHNRCRLVLCSPQEADRRIEAMHAYYARSGLAVNTVKSVRLSGLLLRSAPQLLFIISRLPRKCFRMLK